MDKLKWLYQNWPMHNLISHPLSEIVYWVVLTVKGEDEADKISGFVHDFTIPEDYEKGRG